MSRLLDATICPDCRAALDAAATCTVCGLRVSGPVAAQLWRTMTTADQLVEQLRSAPMVRAARPTVSRPAAPASGLVAAHGTTTAPLTGSRSRARQLPSASVPAVLLSLGALCLMVAAVVFVAVTWDVLGLTGRTLVLLGLTALLAAVAVVVTRKGLRGAAETFWLVVAGMLTVDLLAAHSAGIAGLDALEWQGTGAWVGVVQLTLGVSVGLWARRQPVSRLWGVQVVAAVGGLMLCATQAWTATNLALATAIALPLLAGAFVSLRRQLPVAAYGLGGLAVTSWMVLLGVGWDQAHRSPSAAQWLTDALWWPLLVAALLAAVVVHLPAVPERARSVVAGLAMVPLVLLVGSLPTSGAETRELLVSCATLVSLGLVAAFAPRAWAQGAAALTALGIVGLGLPLVAGPWLSLSSLHPSGRARLDLALTPPTDMAAPWTSVLLALCLIAAAACLLRHVPATQRPTASRAMRTLAPGILALGASAAVLASGPPLWAGVLAAGSAAAVAGVAAWWSRDHVLAAGCGCAAAAYLAVLTLSAALAADLLTALTSSALALSLVTVGALRERVGARLSAGTALGLATVLGGAAVLTWGEVLRAGDDVRALSLAVYAAAVAVGALPSTRRTSTRITLELAALLLALAALAIPVSMETTAMVLTVIGSALCLVAVTAHDRSTLGWLAAAVLGAATGVRVLAEVSAPELYTLPAAAVLIAVGGWRLRRDPETSSFAMLGSGLTLALLPSLVLTLQTPVSARGALIAVAGVLVLAVGVHQRLAAPFVLGAGTTSLLALRHLEPVAAAVDRWIALGALGMALLAVGVTWEARRRNLEHAQDYLTALR